MTEGTSHNEVLNNYLPTDNIVVNKAICMRCLKNENFVPNLAGKF
jgi:hypothetical protein